MYILYYRWGDELCDNNKELLIQEAWYKNKDSGTL